MRNVTVISCDEAPWIEGTDYKVTSMHYQSGQPSDLRGGTYWYNTATGGQFIMLGNLRTWYPALLQVEHLELDDLTYHKKMVERTQKRITVRTFQAEVEAELQARQRYENELARILSNPNYGNF